MSTREGCNFFYTKGSFIEEVKTLSIFHSAHTIFGNFVLLGDSGYAQRPWLMTPVRNPVTLAQVHYNSVHTGTRFKIENAFSI